MMEWFAGFYESLTWGRVLIAIGLFLVSLAVTFGAIAVVLIKVPHNYFSSHYQRDLLPNSSWAVRWGAVVLKNVIGVFLVLVGLVLSLPVVPGPGLLTILIGLIMIDIPGKRPFEARILKRPTILGPANRLRARYKKEPLMLD